MSASINNRMGARDWFLLLFLSLIWGSSFFFNAVGLRGLPVLSVIALRVSLAAITLWMVVLGRGLQPPRSLRVWGAFLVMGLVNNVIPFSLVVWSQTHITSGLASILNATTPLFTVVLAGLLLPDEKITLNKALGMAVGFSGVVFMIGPAALKGIGTDTLAQAAMLGATLCYASSGVYARRFKTMGVNPIMTAAGQATASSLILIPLTLIIDQPFASPLPRLDSLAAVAGLGILGTALAFTLFFRLLGSAGATNAALVTFLIPVWAILLGTFVLHERLDSLYFFGMLILGIGLSFIDGRLWTRRKASLH
ncbi:MAG: DMT family transporter [Anaerolineales bacterium]|nr:DMT family transporter [Anaerolineales bacterium]